MKKLFIPLLFLLVSCKCLLPQIPPQYLPADNNCEAFLPNYLEFVSVWDNCGNAAKTQEPIPGTILDANNPYYKVTITATDIFGNIDQSKIDVYLWDNIPPQIIWDSIPSDTIPIARVNDIDKLIESYETYRTHLGDTAIQKSFTVYY